MAGTRELAVHGLYVYVNYELLRVIPGGKHSEKAPCTCV